MLTDIDVLLMAEKGTRGGICHTIHRYAKANNKYMKSYDKNIESSYLMYLDATNLYGWVMSQKLPVDSFKWIKKLSEFNEDFMKYYDKNNDKGYVLEVYVLNIQKISLIFIVTYHFYLKERKLKNARSLFVTYITKKTILYI